MPSRPPRQYLEATRIAQAPRSSRTAWLSQLFPVSDILDTTTGTATRRMPTLRLPGRMCDPPTINRLEILSICGSSATRWSQVQQAARGDESGHIGTRRLKPGGAGRGPNGATDGVALAEFELSEPARRFRDHHPLTAFQQIAARRSKLPMSCHARGSHGRALPARVRSPLPFPKRGSRGPLRLFRVPGAKPGGRGGSGFHPAMDRVHSWCRGSREQPAQFHRTRQLATLLEGGANLRLLPREQRTCRQAERGRQASGRRTGPR